MGTNTTAKTLRNKPKCSEQKLCKFSYKDENFSLLFQPLEEKDAVVIYSAVENSLKDLLPFMDWSHRELDISKQLERIRQSRANLLEDIAYDFSVFNESTSEFLMSASLHPARVPNKKALGIGYWTCSKYCNKGLATIATKILTAVAFENLGCDRVEIGCNKANQKSIKVIEKCNFKFEYEARNYFSEPTPEMVLNGYNPERSGMLYSIIKQDLQYISWYRNVCQNIRFN